MPDSAHIARTQIALAHALPFRLGGMVVEPALRQVAVAQSEVETLEPRVMQVLVVLALANNGIVSRDDLVHQCWEGRVVGDDAINRVIGRLRKLTDKHGDGAVRIETITKVGYRLVGPVALIASRRPAPLAPPSMAMLSGRSAVESLTPQNGKPILAVMPFDNLGGGDDMAYFSDGISEEILQAIARARGIRVIGKASSFRFRDADKTSRQIFAELGATHMLDGSVRRAGGQIRINAQLVDTQSQLTLWSERYDRAATDILVVQDEIATAIAAALDTHFTPAAARTAIDPKAYDLYLQARAIYGRDNSLGEQRKCIALLEATVARAPEFAPAWGLLAMFRGLTLPRTSDSDGEAMRIAARAEAARALAIDPECGQAMMAMALLRPAFGHYAEKTQLAESAYRMSRGDSTVAAFYAASLANIGRVQEACDVLDAIVAREPLAASFAATRAHFYRSAGRRDDADRLAIELETAFPQSEYAMVIAGMIAIYAGDYARAQAIVARAPPGQCAILRSTLAFHQASGKHHGAARTAWLRDLLAASYPVSFIVQLGNAAHVGEADLAIDHLLQAIIENRPIAYDANDEGRGVARANIPAALFGVPTEALRRHPRFAEACVRLGLYAYWHAHDRWPDCADDVADFYDFKAECARVAAAMS
jgi:TolB-like protein/Flp pilus assembly protein TadD